MIRRVLSVVLLSLAVFTVMGATPASAQLTEVQALNFGEWIVLNNSGHRNIVVQTDGNYNSSPELFMMSPPQPGIYRVDGLAPFAAISSVDVTMTQPLIGGGSQVFVMDSFNVLSPNADGSGTAFITVGARARTSGNGVGYADGNYSGVLDLVINL